MKGNRPFTKYGIIFYGCLIFAALSFLSSCSLSKKIAKQADSILFKDTIISTGHIGISIYEPAANKYWYNYDAEKYFVPASNAKLFTMYAAMKYLGDSLVGLRYQQTDSGLIIYPTGDPTFLNADFTQQPVFNFLKAQTHIMYNSAHFTDALGKGWAWDDYMDPYMVQRSEFPIYSNLISVYNSASTFRIIPPNIPLHFQNQPLKDVYTLSRTISRKWDSNDVTMATSLLAPQKNVYQIPLVANYYQLPQFLSDTLQQKVKFIDMLIKDSSKANAKKFSKIYSQPTDSLLKPMLYTSDNFFAEQSLLMVSNEHLGYMGTDAIIDTLLKTDLRDVPQKPRWVDGCGLSRYNLFSPLSFVYILNKAKNEFGIQRLQSILPTGGQGTLKNFYQKDSSFIFAKTGSLSNNSAISGMLYSKKGKLLIFSVLANQFVGSATKVRHSVEKFLEAIREKY